jgi:hypothetical protein
MAIDTGLATHAGTTLGGQSFLKQRTVNPPMVPARYNFLYAPSRPALRAAVLGRTHPVGGWITNSRPK